MELGTLAIGAVAGFIVGALVFTATGKEISRATGARVAHHVRPKSRR